MSTTSCAPCAFAALSTSLLSFPTSITPISISSLPTAIATIAYGGATPSTYLRTITRVPTTISIAADGAVTTLLLFDSADQLVWTTFDAVLSYPTTYIDYIAFEGNAVTDAGCATTLAARTLSIPSSIPTRSLIYPLDLSGALPAGLLVYLDSQQDFLSQLNNYRLESCVTPVVTVPAAAATSSTQLATLSGLIVFSVSQLASASSSAASTSSNTTFSSFTSVASESSSQTQSALVGLSGGASAGIGVGTAVAVIVLTGLGVLLWLRVRRRRQGRNTTKLLSEGRGAPIVHEIDGQFQPRQELDPQDIAEMQHHPAELKGYDTAHELEGRNIAQELSSRMAS